MATLKHHWKFNGNLQDAVGDCHLVDGGIPTYVQNKDGVDNSAMQPVEGQLTKSYSITDGFEKGSDNFSYSFWCRFVDAHIGPPDGSDGQIIYRGLTGMGGATIFVNNWYNQYRPVFSAVFYYNGGNSWGIDDAAATTEYIESWHFITITVESDIFGEGNYDANYTVRIYIDGVLRNTPSATHTGKIKWNMPNAIGFGGTSKNSPNIQIDEFKFFDGILDDGGLTVKGQIAKPNSEIWLLYLDGVNNRPRYTLNEATNVTATTATVSWTK